VGWLAGGRPANCQQIRGKPAASSPAQTRDVTRARPFPLRARTVAEPQPDLTSMVVAHRAMRQDLARLAVLAGDIADRDQPSGWARAFGRYTAALFAEIRAHHQGEDEILWPVIAATARQSVDLAPLADDHQAIGAASVRASQALASLAAQPGIDATALAASVAALRDMVDEHIADEEAQLFPAMRRYLTAQAWRWCEKQIMRAAAPPGLRFTMPWLARHAADGELRALLAAAGWRARVLLAVSAPGYGRLERRAFGPSPDLRRSRTAGTKRKERAMFADTKTLNAFAVDDLAQARKFYGETLGVRVSQQHGLLTLHLAGSHDTRVYPKPDHTPATYTILMFQVDDIGAAVGELTQRGVQFERYDGMDQDERGITRGGGPFIAAWFKDPAGNILEVLQER
jgi:catechol 2,3-dioxygenase-like lactoylglutathione lyase family enzyme/iron-sulfur cluster repair protein YtfE (RIC family)